MHLFALLYLCYEEKFCVEILICMCESMNESIVVSSVSLFRSFCTSRILLAFDYWCAVTPLHLLKTCRYLAPHEPVCDFSPWQSA